MTNESSEEIMSSENFKTVANEVLKTIDSLSETLDVMHSKIYLGAWIAINFILLRAHKNDPDAKIQNLMNQVTINQNKWINNNPTPFG